MGVGLASTILIDTKEKLSMRYMTGCTSLQPYLQYTQYEDSLNYVQINVHFLRETLRLASMLLQGAGHMLITCASMMKRIIEGADLLQTQRGPVTYRAQWD